MPDFQIEKSLNIKGPIFGLDEAGRGPWCGPVVAACAYWPDYQMPMYLAEQIDDSKKLTAKKREKLYGEILKTSCIYGIGFASADEIDGLNILNATFLAMQRALEQVYKNTSIRPEYALIDGNRTPKNWSIPTQSVVKGDHLSLSIATASILAKVTRDNFMKELSAHFPQYGWDKNMGYGTQEHIDAIRQYGITPYHRRSYAPIQTYLTLHPNEK